MLGLPGMKKRWIGCFINENLYFTTEDTEDTEFFSLSFPQVKQSDTYDYKYVILFFNIYWIKIINLCVLRVLCGEILSIKRLEKVS